MKHYLAASFFGTLAIGHLWRWAKQKREERRARRWWRFW